jgi:D-glycero-D-manno-heptose 1,7-bisphosphate phosphatase
VSAGGKSTPRAGLFLDRDGTLIYDLVFVKDPKRVRLLPGTREGLRLLRDRFLFFLFTNQSGVPRGYFGWDDVEKVIARMTRLIGMGPDLFAASCIAAEMPGGVATYRKPSPRFILECIDQFGLDPEQCWMLGDRASDALAGLRAGIRAAFIRPEKGLDDEMKALSAGRGVPAYDSVLQFAEALPEPVRPQGH